MKRNRLKKKHFTLMEMIVVIMIIATLASVGVPAYMKYVEKANISTAKSQIANLKQVLNSYKLDMKTYPTSLEALIENPDGSEKWDGPYLDPPKIPLDPWGNNYIYVFPGEHGDYDLSSYGADGQPGGTGKNADINSWE